MPPPPTITAYTQVISAGNEIVVPEVTVWRRSIFDWSKPPDTGLTLEIAITKSRFQMR
jgi:hypothetical protein